MGEPSPNIIVIISLEFTNLQKSSHVMKIKKIGMRVSQY